MIFPDVVASVGRTPLVEIRRFETGARLFAKLEARNPCGSVKDRVGAALVEDAERRGVLKPGAMLVEPTSGNTGIALAFVASAKGYALTLVMPEHISQERVAFLRMLGAEILFTPGSLMREAVRRAEEIVASTPGAVMLQQFRNPANPEVHRRTTAEEVWADTNGEVDVLVCGVGTGGTITGVGEVLKERRPGCRVVAVEPAGAAVLSGRAAGAHHLPGLGAGFVPEILNRAIIDEVVAVTEEQAVRAQLHLARKEGIAAGMSSGAALHAAATVARRPDMAGKRFVVILPDGGERYANNPVFTELSRKVGRGS
ncbi:MAG TPA: cysteine synthase A [Polyangia bacterium]|nr:cysteine synthase A [Polyangia bacterium]